MLRFKDARKDKEKKLTKSQIIIFIVLAVLVGVGIHIGIEFLIGLSIICAMSLGSCPSDTTLLVISVISGFLLTILGVTYLGKKKFEVSAKVTLLAYLTGVLLFFTYHSVWYVLDPYIKNYQQGQKHKRLLSDWDNVSVSGEPIVTLEIESDQFSQDKYAVVSVKSEVTIKEEIERQSLDKLFFVEFPVVTSKSGVICQTREGSDLTGYAAIWAPRGTGDDYLEKKFWPANNKYVLYDSTAYQLDKESGCEDIKLFQQIKPDDIKIIKVPKEQL